MVEGTFRNITHKQHGFTESWLLTRYGNLQSDTIESSALGGKSFASGIMFVCLPRVRSLQGEGRAHAEIQQRHTLSLTPAGYRPSQFHSQGVIKNKVPPCLANPSSEPLSRNRVKPFTEPVKRSLCLQISSLRKIHSRRSLKQVDYPCLSG